MKLGPLMILFVYDKEGKVCFKVYFKVYFLVLFYITYFYSVRCLQVSFTSFKLSRCGDKIQNKGLKSRIQTVKTCYGP